MRQSMVYQEEPYKDYLITLIYDSDCPNPRDEENLSKMICFHKRYNLGDKHEFNSQYFNTWEQVKKEIIKKDKSIFMSELYLYDHSGLSIRTKPFNCMWDSGVVGFVYTTKEIIKQFGLEKEKDDKIIKIIESEVRRYNDFLNGNCVGYEITKNIKCPVCGHIEKECIDSCWGFYPDENDKFDYVIDECRYFIDNIKES